MLSEIIKHQKRISAQKAEEEFARKPTIHESLEPVQIPAAMFQDATTSKNPTSSGTNAFPETPRDGLFDVFKIPDPPAPIAPRNRGPQSFPKESVDQYWTLLDHVLNEPKAQRKNSANPVSDEMAKPAFDWLRSEEPAVEIAEFRSRYGRKESIRQRSATATRTILPIHEFNRRHSVPGGGGSLVPSIESMREVCERFTDGRDLAQGERSRHHLQKISAQHALCCWLLLHSELKFSKKAAI